MAAGDLIQSATDTGTSPTASLPAASTAGNTLVAITGHRSADGTPSLSGDGWTLVEHYKTLMADASNRRAVAVFVKPADGQQSVQATWSPSRTNALVLREFEGEFDPASFVDSVGDSGADEVDTLATGTTPAVPDSDSLAVTAAVWRRGDVVPIWQSPYGSDVNVFTGTGSTLLEVGGASTLVSAATEAVVIWSSLRTATCTHAVVVLAPAGVETTPQVTAEIPLTLTVAAATETAHLATAEIPLTLAVDATTSAPEIPVPQVTAAIPLTVTLDATTETSHAATADIPLTLTVTATTATPGEAALIDLHVIALTPELGHGPGLAPETVTRAALAPEQDHGAAGSAETTQRRTGQPETGHGSTDTDTGHGTPEVETGHGNPSPPTL